MNVQITAKGMELTPVIRDYAAKKIMALNKFYSDRIIRAELIIGKESHHRAKGKYFFAECKLQVPGKDLFAAKKEEDLYKAIDKIRDYLELELNKRKAKQGVNEKDKKTAREKKEYKIEM